MATGIITPRVTHQQRLAAAQQKQPNLPVIEHPSSRLGDRRFINVTGSSRGNLITPSPVGSGTPRGASAAAGDIFSGVFVLDSEEADNLPPLHAVNDNRGRRHKHNRMLTWPPVHEAFGEKRSRSAKAKYQDAVPKQRYAPEQLYELIKDRYSTSYYAIRQSFRANDPLGKGNAPKSAIGRILFHVIGYISTHEVNKLLERLGLHQQETINFEQFTACFRDREIPKHQWLSPVTRVDKTTGNPDVGTVRELPDEYKTASFSNALLKDKCKHSNFHLRDHLAPSCFDNGGVVLRPQLQECLASLGLPLDQWEMDKLWQRYDLENTGAISSPWFFAQLGLDNRGQYSIRAQTAQPRSHRYSRSPVMVPQIQEDPSSGDTVNPDADNKLQPRQSMPDSDIPRAPSVDIISSLIRRVEQGFHSILMGFEHFDHQNNGMVTKAQFCNILLEYDIPLSSSEADVLLERCGVKRKDGVLSYKDFLHKYMSRAENGMAHRIIMDPSHRFNTRAQTPMKSGSLSAVDAEAKLLEILHKEFLKLLGTLKNLDMHGLNLITQKQFRNTVDIVFGIRITDQQFQALLRETGTEPDGLVSYPEFLAIFNRVRPVTAATPMAPLFDGPTYGKPSIPSPRPPALPRQPSPQQPQTPEPTPQEMDQTTPPEYHRQWRKDAENRGLSTGWLGDEVAKEQRKKNKMETRYRPVKELEESIAECIKTKGYKAQEAYEKIDRKSTGRLSKTQMHYWLQELGILLHPTELQTLWSSLDIATDGLVHYAELFDYFLHRSKKHNVGTNKSDPSRHIVQHKSDPSRHIVQHQSEYDQPLPQADTRRDHFSSPVYDNVTSQIVGLIRPKVLKYWNEIKNALRDLDPVGVGTIHTSQFQNLCHQSGFNLSPNQLERLCDHFDFNQNGQFHYLQFMQLFLESSSSPHHKSSSSRTKQPVTYRQASVQQGLTPVAIALGKVKKQLPNDWKAIRRAFKKADMTKEGRLSIPDFCLVLQENKINAKDEDLYQIFSELDSGMDGKIAYDKFLSLVNSS